MTVIHAKTALLADGWADDVTVLVDADGRICALEKPSDRAPDHTVGILLPAPGNVHSHAFQRAMAGLTEHRGTATQDSFWTWRQLMYRFLDQITPRDVQDIAAMVQMEMLEAGYGAVGEFHYLHHQPDGAHYDDPAEMAARIAAATTQSGIGLTLLPVLYHRGGVDGRALGAGQRRFGTDPDDFIDLHEASRHVLDALPGDSTLGVAPHSLRAVSPAALRNVVDHVTGPLHMHIAEQVGEVTEVEAAYGARPVDWLLDNQPPDSRWCLIHCTQMTASETTRLAATGAVAGLCPITESSLGDGIFDGARWLNSGGALAVGSDSNIRISLNEEMRQLEYSQRLRDRARAVLAAPGGSTGRRIFLSACAGGAQALGRSCGAIAPGHWADLLALDATLPDFTGRSGDALIDTWIFALGDAAIADVWSAGRHMVRAGRHVNRAAILSDYRACLTRLAGAM